MFRSVITDGQRDGSIDPKLDPLSVTLLLWALSNGVIRFIDSQSEHMAAHGVDISHLMTVFLDLHVRALAPATRTRRLIS